MSGILVDMVMTRLIFYLRWSFCKPRYDSGLTEKALAVHEVIVSGTFVDMDMTWLIFYLRWSFCNT